MLALGAAAAGAHDLDRLFTGAAALGQDAILGA